jgi:hypothetical protein
MSYFNVAQQGHVVSILPPVDINGGKTADSFSMENWSHASIIITMGVTHSTGSVITVSEGTTATTGTDIAFKMAIEATALGDTLAALTVVSSSGFTSSTNDGIIYVIELDAADLSAGYHWVTLDLATPGGSSIASAVAILSGGRYSGDQSATAIV